MCHRDLYKLGCAVRGAVTGYEKVCIVAHTREWNTLRTLQSCHLSRIDVKNLFSRPLWQHKPPAYKYVPLLKNIMRVIVVTHSHPDVTICDKETDINHQTYPYGKMPWYSMVKCNGIPWPFETGMSWYTMVKPWYTIHDQIQYMSRQDAIAYQSISWQNCIITMWMPAASIRLTHYWYVFRVCFWINVDTGSSLWWQYWPAQWRLLFRIVFENLSTSP